MNAALEDEDLMILQQLAGCSGALANAAGCPMAVRPNYGTCTMPSLFGCETYVMDDALNTLPTSKPVPAGADDIRRLVAAGAPDVNAACVASALATAQRFKRVFSPYLKVSRYVHIYHPDLQGPMDICELIWGSSIFIDIVDHPDLVKDFLAIITETYINAMREWLKIVPMQSHGLVAHWSMMQKGPVMLRDDSAMNFSASIFEEFIQPYDQRILDEFGGGAIHFCGRGVHYSHRCHTMRNLYAVNLTQPELNDMETIYRNTVDKGIRLLSLRKETADEAIAKGRPLHGLVYVG